MKKRKKAKNFRDGLPEKFIDRLRKIVPEAAYPDARASFHAARPAAFRVHKPGIHPADVPAVLEREGLKAEPAAWAPSVFVLRDGGLRDLQRTRLYREGLIYIQGLSSAYVPFVLAPRAGEKVLDLCAAPGSKTTQMALLMEGRGELIANDVSRARFFRLRALVEAQGLQGVQTYCGRGEAWGRKFPGMFDKVLLDAPCSSEGRFLASKPETTRYWSLRKVHEMAHKQKALLLSAFSCLKTGGVMVYATCTFAPEENEGVLAWGLEHFGDAAELMDVATPFPETMPGLTSWEGLSWKEELTRSRRILPTPEVEAFFIAKIRKREPWQAGVPVTGAR